MKLLCKGIEILYRADGGQRFKGFVEVEKKTWLGGSKVQRHYISVFKTSDTTYIISYDSDIFTPVIFDTEMEAMMALDDTLARYRKEDQERRDAVIVKTEDKYL